jgi:hypothetical protein
MLRFRSLRPGIRCTIVALLASLSACAESRATATDTPETPAVATRVRLSPRDTTLATGSSLRFSAAVFDASGQSVASGAITWTSRNPAVVRVGTDGTVDAIAVGDTRIVASRGALMDSVQVTVTAAPAQVDFTVQVNTAARSPISRFVYGMNLTGDTGGFYAGAFPWYGAQPPAAVPFDRFGGNRFSAYNWENNFSHAGVDYQHQNDAFLSESRTPAAAVTQRVAASRARGAATLVTVPMLGWVAADANGPMDTIDATRTTRLATRFRRNLARKPTAFTDQPDKNDDAVYQDEFVRYLTRALPGAVTDPQAPLMFSLDNEPDSWHATHKAIMGDSADDPQRPRLQTYEGFLSTTVAFASAIKKEAPGAIVFGPAVATYAGVLTIGRYPFPDPQHGTRSFVEFYLERLAEASRSYETRLVDVLDIHWYSAAGTNRGEISNDYALQDDAMIRARLQSPRSLWDPTYDEQSWVSGVTGGPIALLPRLKAMIAQYNPGTKIAFTEYYYGRSGDISGGLVQADVLGIFGRDGVFAANLWPQAGVWAEPWVGDGRKAYAYAFGAFRSFLDYDGNGARFGDTSVGTVASDTENASAYGSLDAQGRVILVLVNKRNAPVTTEVQLAHDVPLRTAATWVVKQGQPNPAAASTIPVSGNRAVLTLEPWSITTVRLSP